FSVPPELNPLRYDPDQRFTLHPITGQRFGTDPATGKPRQKHWQSIWMDTVRPAYRGYF
ncbi:MAG: hypothetical protein GWO24_32550, partial [Akkermansiaceae bacterium]|nr:hypothetical protein [Akkermansiaceae bacterium]